MLKVFENKNIKIEVSENGAELKSLKSDGIEYIWYSRPEYWRFCAPFLFPIVGTLKDKETIINGKIYKIPQHGIVRTKKFKYLGIKENTMSFVDCYDEETLKTYPFKYQLNVDYILDDNKLTTLLTVKNLGDDVMPFNIGGHPAFNVPLYENETFEDYKIIFEEKESFKSPKVMSNATLNFEEVAMECNDIKEISLKKSLFDIDTIILPTVKSRSVKLVNKELKGIKFTFNNFNTLAIWTPFNDAPFVCLEPWRGYNDRYDSNKEFITKDNLVFLKENDTYQVSYTIELIK